MQVFVRTAHKFLHMVSSEPSGLGKSCPTFWSSYSFWPVVFFMANLRDILVSADSSMTILDSADFSVRMVIEFAYCKCYLCLLFLALSFLAESTGGLETVWFKSQGATSSCITDICCFFILFFSQLSADVLAGQRCLAAPRVKER